MDIAAMIRSRRAERQWTQAQLAEKLEVRRATLSAWERGDVLPSTEKLPRLAEVLRFSDAALMQGLRRSTRAAS